MTVSLKEDVFIETDWNIQVSTSTEYEIKKYNVYISQKHKLKKILNNETKTTRNHEKT